MKTPIEIVRETLCRHGAKSLISASLDADIVASLEAAGYAIANPDQVTEEMTFAARRRDPRKAIAGALRAAPKWTKGKQDD